MIEINIYNIVRTMYSAFTWHTNITMANSISDTVNAII